MDERVQFLLAVAPTVLLLAVMVAGVVLAIVHRRQQPWTARLVIPGLVALAANIIGLLAVCSYTQRLSVDRYQDASVAAQHLASLHSVLYARNFIGIVLIPAAVFADRGVLRVGRLKI